MDKLKIKKDKHPWITNKSNQVFSQPFFDLINLSEWNKELPVFYNRINSLDDDRSFVILMAIVLEYHLDKLLRALIPDYDTFIDNGDITFSIKLNLLKSLRILPAQVFRFTDFVRKIRNEFAHNLKIDSIEELKNGSTKEKKIISNLEQLCKDYEHHLVNSKSYPNDYRLKFKDIADFAIHAFREYEPNIIALREEIDSIGFEQRLSDKKNNKLVKLDYIE